MVPCLLTAYAAHICLSYSLKHFQDCLCCSFVSACERGHVTLIFLWLAYFAYQTVLQFPSCYYKEKNFVNFYGSIAYPSAFPTRSTVEGHLGWLILSIVYGGTHPSLSLVWMFQR